MAKSREPDGEIPLDPGEKRWQQHRLVGRDGGGGQVHAYNATATPLDAYHHAKVITQRQYDAGNWLRDNWVKAGREPRMTPVLEALSGGGFTGFITDAEVGDELDERQTRAWKRVAAKLKRLDRETASCVWNVCCMGLGAEAWAASMGKPGHVGMVVLKAGLDGMAGRGGETHN